MLAIALLLGGFSIYGQFSKGVSFFPQVEPNFMQVQVRARDNFSVFERDALVRAIEVRIIGYGEITSICARSMMVSSQGKEETIGTLLLELPPWDTQRTTTEIGEDLCNLSLISQAFCWA
ncbi:hypothetical protein PM03_13755 [Thalassobacter stenotrophicus]|uniref:efflux RND transporter permease subunit n=1 Tax=Thalassobacter stenotrophicus TaxID=266809 RepID=UPI00051CEC79|nr:hypothetical protein PM03_13755 [Thalassobacter stenotrophicus]KGL00773.1 hypothetical protein PM04_12650 [Thalassobacter sp. 16PALIMAR09]